MAITKFSLPSKVALDFAQAAKARRLSLNFSRNTLSALSTVPAPTIRKFEDTGMIGFQALLRIANALDCMERLDPKAFFPIQPDPMTLKQFMATGNRKRGRT